MKICVVCPNDLSKMGGVQDVVRETVSRFIKLGHTVRVVSIKPAIPTEDIKVDFFGSGLPVNVNGTFTEFSFENIEESGLLKKYFEREEFDVVCVHHPQAPMLSLEALYYSSAINIGWFHATIIDKDEFAFDLVEGVLSKWLKSRMNGYIAVSPSVAKEWNYIFNDNRGIVLPVGVDIKRFKSANKINLGPQFNILFVGRLDERKGILEAIKMMPLVLKSISAKLWVVGDGEQKNEAKELTSKLGIEKNVVFVGRVSDSDLPKYYKSADVYCAPSLGGESFGIVLVEAMATGTPVVCYANAGYKFPMQGTPWKGSLVRVGSYKGLAKSILELAYDNRLRKKVIDWQNEKVKEFDWDKIVERFLDYSSKLTNYEKG